MWMLFMLRRHHRFSITANVISTFTSLPNSVHGILRWLSLEQTAQSKCEINRFQEQRILDSSSCPIQIICVGIKSAQRVRSQNWSKLHEILPVLVSTVIKYTSYHKCRQILKQIAFNSVSITIQCIATTNNWANMQNMERISHELIS